MVNLKNNHGLKVSLYVSDITGYPMVIVLADMNWYNNNSSCSFETLCDYQERISTSFHEQLESFQNKLTPLSNDTILEYMVSFAMDGGFTYDFCKVVD